MTGSWRERLLWLGAGAALAWILLLGVRRSEPPTPPPTTPQPIAEPVPTTADVKPSGACYLGVLLAAERVDVVAEVTGRLDQVLVEVGDSVTRGQRLAVVNPEDLRHLLRVEEANRSTAETRRRQIALEADRSEREYRRRAALDGVLSKDETEASKFERDNAAMRLEVADAELAEVSARIAQLKTNLARTEIRAPFDGTVSLRYLDAGGRAQAGEPVVRVLGSEGLEVRFAVPPEDAEAIDVGTPVRVEVERPRATLEGLVAHIAPEIDAASQMLFFEARLPSNGDAPAGAPAWVSLSGEEPGESSCLP